MSFDSSAMQTYTRSRASIALAISFCFRSILFCLYPLVSFYPFLILSPSLDRFQSLSLIYVGSFYRFSFSLALGKSLLLHSFSFSHARLSSLIFFHFLTLSFALSSFSFPSRFHSLVLILAFFSSFSLTPARPRCFSYTTSFPWPVNGILVNIFSLSIVRAFAEMYKIHHVWIFLVGKKWLMLSWETIRKNNSRNSNGCGSVDKIYSTKSQVCRNIRREKWKKSHWLNAQWKKSETFFKQKIRILVRFGVCVFFSLFVVFLV